MSDSSLTRRQFVAGALAAGGISLISGCEREPMFSSAERLSTLVPRNPLYIPPTVSPSGLTLTAAPGNVDLGGGAVSAALTYNGSLPGPTIRANRNDQASIVLQNGLTKDTITHWHGMIAPPLMDGHPAQAIAPGSSYSYQFPVAQRAAMLWYHPHPHMITSEQVALGMAGAFIVNDTQEAGLGLPSGPYEVPLVIRDVNYDANGQIVYNPIAGGYFGSSFLVNGTRDPYLSVDTALYRLRILCGSNARTFQLALSNGASFTVIGNDGGLLPAPVQLTTALIGPGERLDVLIDFRNLHAGDRVMLRDTKKLWDLLEFVVTNEVNVPGQIPTVLPAIPALTTPVVTRTFSFDGKTSINGKTFDMNRIDFRVPFGQVERWRFKSTQYSAPHPIHVHGQFFQVKRRIYGRGVVFGWEKGWKDTVLLNTSQEIVEVFVRFNQYRGIYLLHCHQLMHEDMGMMANFEVY